MNLNYKQSQFELFPSAAGPSERSAKPQFLFSSLTLSLENLIISGIILLMLVVFMFSLGVEKGKRVAMVAEGQAMVVEKNFSLRKNVPVSTAVFPSGPANSPVLAPSETSRNENEAPPIETNNEVPPSQVAPSGVYSIQVASFKKSEYAEKEAGALRKKGFEIFVISKGKYAIVCVGQFAQKDKAKVSLNRLIKTYKDSIVRRL